MPIRPTGISLDAEQRLKLAKELFNYTWTLLETGDRTGEQSELMINTAHASRAFWAEFGEPVHFARGEWQISRVYSTLGRAEPALHHARRCLEICEANEICDFDLAYAYEALARANAVAGDRELASRYEQLSRDAAAAIAGADDRALLLSDLETLPL